MLRHVTVSSNEKIERRAFVELLVLGCQGLAVELPVAVSMRQHAELCALDDLSHFARVGCRPKR